MPRNRIDDKRLISQYRYLNRKGKVVIVPSHTRTYYKKRKVPSRPTRGYEETVPHQSKYISPLSEEQIIAEGVPYYHNLKEHAKRSDIYLNIFPKEYDPEMGWHYPVVLQKTSGHQMNRLDLYIKSNGKMDVNLDTLIMDTDTHPRTGRQYKQPRDFRWTNYKRNDVANWETVEKALNDSFYLVW